MRTIRDSHLKPLWSALLKRYRHILAYGLLTNFLILAPSWYMLEVYERVVFSQNSLTLLMLTLMVLFLFAVMEGLEHFRVAMLQQAAATWATQLQAQVFRAAFLARLQSADFPSAQVFGDFRSLREGLASTAIISIMDAPFIFIFLGLVFMIHPALGVLTLAALLIQLLISALNQYRIQSRMQEANRQAMDAQRYFAQLTRQADAIHAMGMQAGLFERWNKRQQGFLQQQADASMIAGRSAAGSKLVQLMLTSLVLGLGCYLVIHNSLPYGPAGMIVASILAARVLAPFSQLVGQWRTLSQSIAAYKRLEKLFSDTPEVQPKLALPAPSGEMRVDQLSYVPPAGPGEAARGQREPFLRQISLNLATGQLLLVAGPSGAGKSTLLRLMAGLVAPSSGKVRLDGVDVYGWDKAALGPYLGYLPQEVALLEGSVADNIRRFGAEDAAAMDEVVQLLQLQTLIAGLPQGLDTQIGPEGDFLSGGQRQLIGLARAMYGKPRIVLLDEPNAHLDELGERVLYQAIQICKQRGCTFVVISHLQQVKQVADLMLILVQGQMMRLGKPDEVLASLQPKNEAGNSAASNGAAGNSVPSNGMTAGAQR
ncbi:type I secretion system permease/ATPase [Methylobacillus flagellatus]|uniref:type I secretion system permease/ATPase n=1 Tax=Methylobacillus flagellatus TaxID=405 RepID=UPI0010F7DDD1|nr:type I secretion system permease/ATPase [Methylobacillus flagellatus]